MKQIQTAENTVASLWSTKKPVPSEYRFSRFLLSADCPEGVLLCSTVTGEVFLLPGEEYEAIRNKRCSEAETVQTLFARRFLVPMDFNEERELKNLRKILTLTPRSKDITSYDILTTTNCNARCFYCYESEMKRCNMSLETADKAVEYIEAHRGDNPVRLAWFGGEPMLRTQVIDRICQRLTEDEVPFSSRMTSNGYLFTKGLAAHAKTDWKLNTIQITLDGTEEVYNQTKAYVGIEGSPYVRVLDNIGYLLEQKIQVDVRLNLDKHNAENLFELLKELASHFGGKKGINVYCSVLVSDCGFNPLEHEEGDMEQLKTVLQELQGKIREYRLSMIEHSPELPILKYFRCMADNPACVQITPEGILSKCEHYIYDYTVGDLEQGIVDKAGLAEWKKYVTPDFCKGCPLIPQCVFPSHCIAIENGCFPVEREAKMANYRYAMRECYEKWKEENTP